MTDTSSMAGVVGAIVYRLMTIADTAKVFITFDTDHDWPAGPRRVMRVRVLVRGQEWTYGTAPWEDAISAENMAMECERIATHFRAAIDRMTA